MSQNASKTLVGWREWVSLPDLGVERIKAKIDTGARTSALHAWYLEPYHESGKLWVRFGLHPLQGNTDTTIHCSAQVVDQRPVTDSGGHTEERFVINTSLQLGELLYTTDMTLTNRDSMRFRMLIGRNSLKPHFIVDPAQSFLLKPNLP